MQTYFKGFKNFNITYFADNWRGIEPENENIIIKSGKKRHSRYLKSVMDDKYVETELKTFYENGLKYTPNTFMPCKETGLKGNRNLSNMYRVVCFGIVIDAKKSKACIIDDPKWLWTNVVSNATTDDTIPQPSAVVINDELTLLYRLSTPINCKYGQSILDGLTHVQEILCARLNLRYNVSAKPCPFNFFVSVPDSKRHGVSTDIISYYNSRYRYDAKSLMTQYLPQTDEHNKRKIHAGFYLPNELLQKWRLEDYAKLQKLGCPKIKTLTYYYAVSKFQAESDKLKAIEDIIAFNDAFSAPLSADMLSSIVNKAFGRKNAFKVKNSTIMGKLGLSETYCRRNHLYLHTAVKEVQKNKRLAQGKTLDQHRQTMLSAIIRYQDNDAKTIASKLGCSVCTVRRWLKVVAKMSAEQIKEITDKADNMMHRAVTFVQILAKRGPAPAPLPGTPLPVFADNYGYYMSRQDEAMIAKQKYIRLLDTLYY